MSKTILVTGGTGYVGSWIVKKLLEKGYTIRLAVRNKSNTARYAFITDIATSTPGSIELWEADLLIEGSYDTAADGADAIMHVASPFKIGVRDVQTELVDPALLGTRNVLSAANASSTVKKVLVTSSVAAIHGDNADMKSLGLTAFTEAQFNTTSSLHHQPYSYSKVVAEKEAWKIFEAQNRWKLVVLNPSFVMGPALTSMDDSTSINFMADILKGNFKFGAPELMFGFVDVRDVADAHILALESDDAHGRYLLAERTTGVFEICQMIKARFGSKYKLPSSKSPKFMLYLIGWMFGLSFSYVRQNIGHHINLDNTKSKQQLGLTYTPLETTIADMVLNLEQTALK